MDLDKNLIQYVKLLGKERYKRKEFDIGNCLAIRFS